MRVAGWRLLAGRPIAPRLLLRATLGHRASQQGTVFPSHSHREVQTQDQVLPVESERTDVSRDLKTAEAQCLHSLP